ncbi:MAG: 23S rRNA (pseudouridine(1915)-N(3))-methyltransferase RlmH [Chthoniobacterales bacterium]|nr:23S rRNA (pseudouridine(1915)-N(3))-methyltransferase RlmH [Chthoniobacterales bacterium]
MKYLILTVGKSALPYAKGGRDEYLARIARFATVGKVTVKASDPAREGAGLLELSAGYFRVVLHERGTALTSRQFAANVDQWRQAARPIAIMVGGADGHDKHLLGAADFLWSLGPLTLPHELALVVALEQLYRAHTILAGHPYHRD